MYSFKASINLEKSNHVGCFLHLTWKSIDTGEGKKANKTRDKHQIRSMNVFKWMQILFCIQMENSNSANKGTTRTKSKGHYFTIIPNTNEP